MKKDIKDIKNIDYLCTLYDKYNGFLTTVQSQVFKLYFHENLSYSEISEITGTTRTAAYDALDKAIKKLLKVEKKMK